MSRWRPAQFSLRSAIGLAAAMGLARLGSAGVRAGPSAQRPAVVSHLARCAYNPWPDQRWQRRIAGLQVLEIVSHGAPPDAALPVVLLLHGYADGPEGPAVLFRDLPRSVRAFVPKGIGSVPGGHAWSPLKVQGSDPKAYARALAAPVAALRELLIQVQARYPSVGRPVVTGFSQGGIVALALATRFPALVHAAVPLAAWLPAAWPAVVSPDRGGRVIWRPPVRALHGRADDRVPFIRARAAYRRLRQQGWSVDLISYPELGHAMHDAMAWQYKHWLIEALENG